MWNQGAEKRTGADKDMDKDEDVRLLTFRSRLGEANMPLRKKKRPMK